MMTTSEAKATRPNARGRGTQLFVVIWLGVLLQVIGEVIDFRWHASHEEFETASDELRAHWLLWIGSLVTLGAAWFAFRASRQARREGLLFALAAGVGYVGVSIWHFLEHAGGADPALPHVLLAVTKISMLVGVIWATVQWRAARGIGTP